MARRLRHQRIVKHDPLADDDRWVPAPSAVREKVMDALSSSNDDTGANCITYDEHLLERARMQWQFGDWASLSLLNRETLQHHPDRASLALLAAAGRLQMHSADEGREYFHLAQGWGVSKRELTRLLVAGVHNSLGRAAALSGKDTQARRHFESAIAEGMPGRDIRLLTQLRVGYQLEQLKIESSHNGESSFLEPASTQSLPNSATQQADPVWRAQYLNRNGEEIYKTGLYKPAVEYFQRALDLVPDNAWYCQNLAEATARLKVKKGEPWECEKLGHSIDQMGTWEVAVRLYRRALKLDPAQVAAHIKAQLFTVDPSQEGQVDNPVFIVGCGHSGTSLMLAILGNHPRINPIPTESGLFLTTDADINKQMRAWDEECKVNGKARWAEKTPPHIFQIARFLALRPKAQFVLMLRDGRDVVCSLKPRIGYAAFEDRLERWIYDNMAGLPYWSHPQVKVVRYEKLVSDTEATLRELCGFLGEEYTPQLVDYHKTEHRWYSDKIVKPDVIKTQIDHLNNRNWQINQPIFDGRGRWEKEMMVVEKNRFKNSFAQVLLEKFGYVAGSDW